jgi:uncharacterized DUF497 family protein
MHGRMASRKIQFNSFNYQQANGQFTFNGQTTFELASTVFFDPHLLTVADVEHSETELRWFSVGAASNGVLLIVVTCGPMPIPRRSKLG